MPCAIVVACPNGALCVGQLLCVYSSLVCRGDDSSLICRGDVCMGNNAKMGCPAGSAPMPKAYLRTTASHVFGHASIKR